MKFRESTRIPSPKVGVALGVWGFTPSHFSTLPGVCDVIPGLSLGPHPCNPFALVASPKLGLWHLDLHMSRDMLTRYSKEHLLETKQTLVHVNNPPKKLVTRDKTKPLSFQRGGPESEQPKVIWLGHLLILCRTGKCRSQHVLLHLE
jgi:hypothetical protein